jgi:hypothetical protein
MMCPGWLARWQRRGSALAAALALVLMGAAVPAVAGIADGRAPGAPTSSLAGPVGTTPGVDVSAVSSAEDSSSVGVPDVDAPFVIADAGNYILYDAEPAMRAAFGDDVLFSTHTIGGFGLSSNPDLWRGVLGTDVPSNNPAVVVMMMGNSDFEIARSDPDWYRALLHDAVRMMTSKGAKVLWLGLPPLPPNIEDAVDRERVNALYAELPRAFPGLVRYVSTDNVLGFAGIWVRSMPDDPSHQPIRKVRPDGSPDMHVCPAGAERVARLVRDEVQSMVSGVPYEPWGWESGDWRYDLRYDDPYGACRNLPTVASTLAGVTRP